MDIKQYKTKIELHAHTSPASGCADFLPREVVRRYADVGVDGLAITNHILPEFFCYNKKAAKLWLEDYYAAAEAGERYGVKVYLGAEVRFCENYNDYLIYGIDEDWVRRITEYLPLGLQAYMREFGGGDSLVIQAHPFRNGMSQEPCADGTEAYNMHPHQNSRNGLAAAYAKKHNHIVTAGSDFHFEGAQGLGLVLAKSLPADGLELAKLLRSRDYLFLLDGKIIEPYGGDK